MDKEAWHRHKKNVQYSSQLPATKPRKKYKYVAYSRISERYTAIWKQFVFYLFIQLINNNSPSDKKHAGIILFHCWYNKQSSFSCSPNMKSHQTNTAFQVCAGTKAQVRFQPLFIDFTPWLGPNTRLPGTCYSLELAHKYFIVFCHELLAIWCC